MFQLQGQRRRQCVRPRFKSPRWLAAPRQHHVLKHVGSAAVLLINCVCAVCAAPSACSAAASFTPPMLVSRVQLSACAVRSHVRILNPGGSRFVAKRRAVQWSDIRLHMRMVLGSIPRVRSKAGSRHMVRWSGIRFTRGRSWVRIPVCPVVRPIAAWFGGCVPASLA